MRTLLPIALLLPLPTMAADFRGTEFGSPCAAVEMRERALGSEQVPINSSDGGAYRFKGRAFDRDVWITYLCQDGALALGDYHFPEADYDAAVADFLAAYNVLLSQYGAPIMAGSQHGKMTAELVVPVVGDTARDQYNAYWSTQILYIHLDLLAPRNDAADKWHVIVVTTPAGK